MALASEIISLPRFQGLRANPCPTADGPERLEIPLRSKVAERGLQSLTVRSAASPPKVRPIPVPGRLPGEGRSSRSNGTVNGAENGVPNRVANGTSTGNSRLVPIEVALSRARGGNGALKNGAVNGRFENQANGMYGRRTHNGAVNGAAVNYTNGAAASTANGAVNGAVNGALNGAANGASTALVKPGTMPSSPSKPGRTIGLPAAQTPLVRPPSGLATPSKLIPIEGGVRVLPSDEGFQWSKDNYNITQRNLDVWSFVLTLRLQLYLLDAKWSYLGGFKEEKQKQRRRRLASWVRESILQLGPTFIKLGQLSSTRSDLLPLEFVEELSKLQDRVPAFTADKAIALIEKELGAPIKELYAEFERRPIAAASLGQVHRAILHNGERVVVKVQRPGLKELFDIDLGNLKIIANYFQNSESLGGPTRDWNGIYEECATILYQEIDYINEGRNADRFRNDFRKVPWVKVPQVYWDYASRKVLTLEYAPGVKINDVERLDALGLNRALVAQHAIEGYLIQILRTGFFHADPHPGNLAVDRDNALIYYDFGMMGEIKAFTKEKLLEMFYAVYEKDAKKVVASLVDLGALVPTGDVNSVRRSIQFFLDNLTGPNVDQQATVSAIGEDLFAIAIDQPFRFPATFTFVLRAFSTLEGVGKTLDPDFSFTRIAAPYAQELLDVRDARRGQDYLVQQLQKQAAEVRDATVQIPTRVQRMDDIIRQLEAGDLKLRVRVLEAERAARRAGILQVATINTVAAGSLLNLGVTLGGQGLSGPATAAFVVAGVFAGIVFSGMKRIQRLDKFEKML